MLAQVLAPAGSEVAKLWALGWFALGVVVVVLLSRTPSQFRRHVITGFTFTAGLVYVLNWIWPKPAGLTPDQIPANASEGFSARLGDTVTMMGSILQVIQGVLLFLGVYSVLRIHGGRLTKMRKDWQYSAALLVAMTSMIAIGYWDYIDVLKNPGHASSEGWQFQQYAKDFLFDGLLQTMDAAMFSIIAFFILNAAYRAFRIRSLEATILLGSALLVMLSLMGGVEYASSELIKGMTNENPGHILNNFSLTAILGWIKGSFQNPSIRGLDWGIGIGALSMGLRLWLNMERGMSS